MPGPDHPLARALPAEHLHAAEREAELLEDVRRAAVGLDLRVDLVTRLGRAAAQDRDVLVAQVGRERHVVDREIGRQRIEQVEVVVDPGERPVLPHHPPGHAQGGVLAVTDRAGAPVVDLAVAPALDQDRRHPRADVRAAEVAAAAYRAQSGAQRDRQVGDPPEHPALGDAVVGLIVGQLVQQVVGRGLRTVEVPELDVGPETAAVLADVLSQTAADRDLVQVRPVPGIEPGRQFDDHWLVKFEVGTKSWPLPPLLVFVPTVNRSLSSQIAWIGPGELVRERQHHRVGVARRVPATPPVRVVPHDRAGPRLGAQAQLARVDRVEHLDLGAGGRDVALLDRLRREQRPEELAEAP